MIRHVAIVALPAVLALFSGCRTDRGVVQPASSRNGITQQEVIAIAANHLMIKDGSLDEFHVSVSVEDTTREKMVARLAEHPKFHDLSWLPDRFAVYRIHVLAVSGSSSDVYVTKHNGKVILEMFHPEG